MQSMVSLIKKQFYERIEHEVMLEGSGIVINCYFENLENIVISNLARAETSLKIAVAWINFNIYGPVLNSLIDKGVRVKILLHDDFANHRYDYIISEMNKKGAKIRFADFRGIMHHKFCIIDKKLCLFGSFNWTQSANIRNIEDLNICDETHVIYSYKTEFKALWELSKSDISLLRNPVKCAICAVPLVNVLLMEQEGHYQTEIRVLQICGCNQREAFKDYFDISLYNNYTGLIDCFNDQLEEALRYNDDVAYNEIIARMDFTLSSYLSNFRNNRMGFSIIHAVGFKTWEWSDKHNGEYVYRIVWKERFASAYIDDVYDIMD